MENDNFISWHDFNKVQVLAGTIIKAEQFEKAKKPAYIVHVDLGKQIGIKKSSAQITHRYDVEQLIGKMVVCITNFPPKQIGPIMSEVLITGFPDEDGNVVLCTPDKQVPNGSKLY